MFSTHMVDVASQILREVGDQERETACPNLSEAVRWDFLEFKDTKMELSHSFSISFAALELFAIAAELFWGIKIERAIEPLDPIT